MVNIIHLVSTQKTPSLLLALDAEKAFNRVDWEYLSQTLTAFGFRGPILSDILALYTSPSAQVYTSGALSARFNISNGTCQGCPLSPLIFNLLIEPLAVMICFNPDISGFRVGGTQHKINLIMSF